MNPMFKGMAMGVVRHFMGGAAVWAVAHGYGNEELWLSITGGALALAAIAWSMLDKRTAAERAEQAKDYEIK